ncbi:hypothetical protein [Candidatus Protochlamydia amoebophila]|uniref:hypothetical protein n=1 Tax=Candidatus Protochlamydia amoebophila TaxID=362787 RepID=UPI0002EF5C8F|nr:hypothetical protein [Candidatus Protochlamydia amoebophila]
MSIGPEQHIQTNEIDYSVQLSLSNPKEEDLEEVDEVIKRCFQALTMLKKKKNG